MKVLIKRGGPNDYKLVERWQQELHRRGLYAGPIDGQYGPLTQAATKRLQQMLGVKDDEIVGPITWSRTFIDEASIEALERSAIQDSSFQSRCVERLIQNARKYLGLREIGNTNRNTKLDQWARALGLPVGIPWCLSSLQGIIKETADEIGCPDPLKPDTAHCLTLLNSVPKEWVHDAEDGIRGDLGIMDFGGGRGHVFLIQGYGAGIYSTLEGNTNDDGSREGYEFCERSRKANDPKLRAVIRTPWKP